MFSLKTSVSNEVFDGILYLCSMKRSNGIKIVVASILISATAYIYISKEILTPFPSEYADVYIPAGNSSDAIGDSLRGRLGNRFGAAVTRLWKLQKGNARRARGHYRVLKGESALSLSRRICNGRQDPIRFTFNNLRTIDELADRAASRFDFTAADFMTACDSILTNRGFKNRTTYPAAFLPDTYEFYWTTPAEKVVERLATTSEHFWSTDRRSDKASALGLSPTEVSTLASIVEEESASRDEHPMIARLYLNRLSKGMPLQADPTVKFANGDFAARRITKRMLEKDSPYNTYRNNGLPPGPIRIADKRTIDAVLNAPSGKQLYMCAKADFSGRHDFTDSYDRHLSNAAAYRRALDRRGIKK